MANAHSNSKRSLQEKSDSVTANGALAGLGLGVAAGSVRPTIEHVTGNQPFYHGTSAATANRLFSEGLQPGFGGSGASKASGVPEYVRNSLGKVHVTPDKSVAKSYASLVDLHASLDEVANGEKPLTALEVASHFASPRRGKVVGGILPYQEFISRFSPDPDSPGSFTSSTPVAAANLKEGGPSLTDLLSKPKNWGSYVKAHPARFAKGVGLGALGLGSLALAGVGAKRVLKNFRSSNEEQKTANIVGRLKDLANPGTDSGGHAWDLAGLGILAAPIADKLQAKARARLAGDKSPTAVEHRQLIPESWHDPMELGGLGVLAAPSAVHLMGKHAHHAFLDELEKLGQITPAMAEAAQARLDQAQPLHAEQIARWATIGALAKPTLGVASDLIKGRAPFGGNLKAGGGIAALRHLAADAASGAVGGGLMPVVRRALDQSADHRILDHFHNQAGDV